MIEKRTAMNVRSLGMLLGTAALAACSGTVQQAGTAAAPVPEDAAVQIAEVTVAPENAVIRVGETVQLAAEARDSDGATIENAVIQYFNGGFEGSVDAEGVVTGGSVGTYRVVVVATAEGFERRIVSTHVRVEPGPAATIALAPDVARLVVGQTFRLSARSYSAIGDERWDEIVWTSSDNGVVAVNDDGVVSAVNRGNALVMASADEASTSIALEVVTNNIASFEISPSWVDAQQGDVVAFDFTARDRRGREIEGLTPAWSFSPGQGMIDQDGAFVGYEVGTYEVTASFGTRIATAHVTLGHRDARRPVQIVGRLPRVALKTEEIWVHPNEQFVYLGTGAGGDRFYVIDVSDPANPVVTDSLVADTRRVNDLMSTPDGRYMVFTREGASSRRNGIVIVSLEDPAHPVPIAEFTEGVTAGVHSAFVYRQEEYGTHVYLTNDGTGALHIVDISDPYNPMEVAQWRTTNRPEAGRSLHDVDIKDGLAYLSYWNDGLVILDIGNGMRGGSPSSPQFVSQYKYDLNELYRDVELTAGAGFVRGTHTAWRHGDYVFIGDEVFPAHRVEGAKDAGARRAYGRLQVLDVTDIEHPRSVAWYEPEHGGVHNVWAAGDTLFLGAYQGGFHAFDISGRLMGDLRAQHREIAHVNTADMDGREPNAARTWGVIYKDGLAYVNDTRNRLWIIRMKEPLRELTP